MDDLDRKILALLRADARLSVATLAKKLDVSRGTISNRITKLERDGVILGYSVRVRPDSQPERIVAWISIAVEGHETPRIIQLLTGETAIVALHDTNGRWDLLAELSVSDLNELGDVLGRIRLIKGISATETSIHLNTLKLN
ncbi:MAG: Lrp/AsnC family transcriptional regulator [Paenalcaligenes sp.]|uniref:Lrp/AsnC family transcriptional regulator n=1 Tax=Paenalcaligenes suwonensis TaxID=1202713 RepID=UPI0014084381|nr:Lrp/AsnC family transcriptional regulator [Paenalcaligenes suwonensis]NHC61594.1 Lrp/AsnC family transcriptional regulator [Paenalcaligenes suwonensis]